MLWMQHSSPLRRKFSKPTKPYYKITNWPAYNKALVARGSLTFWLDEAVIADWHAVSGKGYVYSDMAILCVLHLRSVLKLTLRQCQGFLVSLKQMLALKVEIPHYSTLSRRMAKLCVPTQPRRNDHQPIHLVVDATGLKIFGEGEWKVRTHGCEKGKRRVWRKLHLGVDEQTNDILAHELTGSNIHDGTALPGLLEQIDSPLSQVSADSAYDSYKCHDAIYTREARPVIPPRKGASRLPPPNLKDPPPTRGQIVERIWEIGRKEWKKEAGYHRRSLAETAMFRYKTIIGSKMHSRTFKNQKTEAAIAVAVLNTFTKLGMPQTIKIL